MKKIVAKINKKTGAITLKSEGVQGEACLLITKPLREGLGIDAEPEKTSEYWQEDQTQTQSQSQS